MMFTEGRGDARDVAICSTSYSPAGRNRKGYAGRFKAGYDVHSLDISTLARAVCKAVYSSSLFGGGVRLNKNFIRSHYCVLDIDFIDYTLAQACRDWADSVCIIGTTASHQKPKLNAELSALAGFPVEVKCDRFRIIAPWERPIESGYEFKRNVAFLVDKYRGDASCIDPARLWFPCSEVVMVNIEGYLQPVRSYRAPERLPGDPATAAAQRRDLYGKRLPKWVAAFVRRGKVPQFSDGRQRACFDCACCLRDRGWGREEVRGLLHSAKFCRSGFEPEEIDQAVDSAFKDGE